MQFTAKIKDVSLSQIVFLSQKTEKTGHIQLWGYLPVFNN